MQLTTYRMFGGDALTKNAYKVPAPPPYPLSSRLVERFYHWGEWKNYGQRNYLISYIILLHHGHHSCTMGESWTTISRVDKTFLFYFHFHIRRSTQESKRSLTSYRAFIAVPWFTVGTHGWCEGGDTSTMIWCNLWKCHVDMQHLRQILKNLHCSYHIFFISEAVSCHIPPFYAPDDGTIFEGGYSFHGQLGSLVSSIVGFQANLASDCLFIVFQSPFSPFFRKEETSRSHHLKLSPMRLRITFLSSLMVWFFIFLCCTCYVSLGTRSPFRREQAVSPRP